MVRAGVPDRAGRPPRVGSPGRPLRGTGRERSSVGSVPIVMRPGSRRKRNRIVAVRDVVDLAGGVAERGDTLDLVGLVVWVDWLIVAPHRRLAGERRPHIEVVGRSPEVPSRSRCVASHRWAARSSAAAGRCRTRRTTGRPTRRHRSRRTMADRSPPSPSCWRLVTPCVVSHAIPLCSLRPRGVLALCGRTPCRSSQRARG